MNSKLIGSLFVIVTLVVGIVAFAPSAFAQSTASVTVKKGAGSSGSCTTDCFQPGNVSVDVGGTVTWTNTDAQLHTVSSGNGPNDNTTGSVFDTGFSTFKPGTTFSHTFADAGTFNYYCQLHPWMVGVVTVAAASTTPAPTETPNATNNNAVPEFGPVASLVLVIAIVSVVAVTAKTRGFLKL
ncbi:MAG TPA: plastocyanin/azurin family copper-binding protein [Nitrosopumilaceae archaeon]|nr:plastocyanin/azurin family copper-binding protein [Nitrosopumilaceae archaeon]